ncbi:sigma-54 dependent transcriptional regulator [Desulfuromonas acetoxidans]|uniref:Two component, sigma54 specific, transcriptional regulator, Fis family n=1 Tax=Desulfuromonas acetoxidans (strain DSM 684 / 11070) TaxID=281689 RepID=Q1K104_DESA6|nr:sigma-54 dependent transcriptional regulator [Desulfuromonas acetoxidans]EAT16204.1 two component, sigma54 specific, transcriptional regulator, Fis family [Desulfuromonas acetoxidans DSM 684]MBF0645222.1 sigma-54-dependent Fis family transcriptional regulator [Desulfuromonas acetoxidans]NVD23034.1 sigma-54-dependent Fis family transcriptional regulator [Desulfuromonas acetoxidans]NVE15725.1 sigma-54-dependent Fis family transcriptional regulator [Desulfuromonas acetoxidans]
MDKRCSILLIDDDEQSCATLGLLLKKSGYSVETALSGEQGLELLPKTPFEIVITDLRLPGMDGLEILKRVKEHNAEINVILVTGNSSAESAVTAMKYGAFDYITKPLNFDKLKVILDKAQEKLQLVAENRFLRQQLRGRYTFDNIIGTSMTMQQVFSRMQKVLHTDSSLLILGESGTGKELVAKAIHFNGPRKDQPFVPINCGAIPADLLESELFGHLRGSFTGAIANKCGKFEQANGGTIFLDEIGTMPVHLQLKLLRVLQEQEVQPVGSNRNIKLDVRVISATNADLEQMVRDGHFREDLFYRLNVIPITLPPLRQRSEDIALLVRHFLQKSCRYMNRSLMPMESAALQVLENYDWPGNVRELENVIERTVALSDGPQITLQDLPPHITGKHTPTMSEQNLYTLPADGVDMPKQIQEIERHWISQALEMSQGIKARAAAMLGINRTTLVEKIKRLGLPQ